MLRGALGWVQGPVVGFDSVVLRRQCLNGQQKTEVQGPPFLASAFGQVGGRDLEPVVVGEEVA